MCHYIAVDAGGTQLRAACYPAGSNTPVKIRRIPTRSDDTSTTERLLHLIETIWPEDGGVAGIALAVPGAVNPFEGVVYTSQIGRAHV